MRYILASQSPRRQELLRLILPNFSVLPADIDEIMPQNMPISHAVAHLAGQKAQAVFLQNHNAVVIGSDTVVVVDGQVLGKPKDAADAAKMLDMLSNRTHEVITGFAISNPKTGKIYSESTVTSVSFAQLTTEEIYAYIATGEPMDKAGAYGIQGLGARFVQGIKGDYYSVMGLPVRALYAMLRDKNLL